MDDARANAEPFTLLIVDDDATLQHALASVLTPLGYRVLSAASAEQAYLYLSGRALDAVLLDVRLPTISGFDLYLVIAQRWPHLERRLALMTGDADADDVRSWQGVRHTTLLCKPFHPRDVLGWLEGLKRS